MSKGLAPIADAMRKTLPPDEFIELVKALVHPKYVQRDGVAVMPEADFAGSEAAHLYPVLVFILEVNYLHFLDDLGLSGLLQKKTTTAEASSAEMH